MTRVRRIAAVAVMTPLATGAIALGTSVPTNAAACLGGGSAELSAPSDVTAGKSFRVTATTRNVVAGRLVVAGKEIDSKVLGLGTGTLSGTTTISNPGTYSASVIGNITGCTYQMQSISVRKRSSGSQKPGSGNNGSGSKTGRSGSGNSGSAGLPSGSGGLPSSSSSGKPLNNNSPFSLPSVAPDGSTPGFQYPTPDPEVASPATQSQARNVSNTTPLDWSRSVAIALVLLLISAHLGMWSRRQRVAAAAAGPGDKGRRSVSRRRRTPEPNPATSPTLAGAVTTTDAASRTTTKGSDDRPLETTADAGKVNSATADTARADTARADTATADPARADAVTVEAATVIADASAPKDADAHEEGVGALMHDVETSSRDLAVDGGPNGRHFIFGYRGRRRRRTD